jgi:hypothetical protein
MRFWKNVLYTLWELDPGLNLVFGIAGKLVVSFVVAVIRAVIKKGNRRGAIFIT